MTKKIVIIILLPISIDRSPQRKGEYYIAVDQVIADYQEIACNDLTDSWAVEGDDVLNECIRYCESCLAKKQPKELDDVGLL